MRDAEASGAREALPERPKHPQTVAFVQLAQAVRARADVLQQEVGLAAPPARIGEGARQIGALLLTRAPALGGGKHRELAGDQARGHRGLPP